MGQITLTITPIPGLLIIEPEVHWDERGYFMETYNRRDLEKAALRAEFVQDNQSMSRRGVLRGMHFQKHFPQGKLVRVISGSIFDVAVDLRTDSSFYGRWFGLELSSANRKQLYIPEGFAHGFLVLSDTAEVCYKTTDYYCPEDEGGLAWNDPTVGIRWPGVCETTDAHGNRFHCLDDGAPLLISSRDLRWPSLDQLPGSQNTEKGV